MDYILVGFGLIALFLGGDALVRGAVGLARHFAMPPLLIGLTIVGFGTSTPELLVSADAALRGVPDIAVGNIVGSNIGNVLLIAGLAALIWPIRIARGSVTGDAVVMMAAGLALVPLFWLGMIGREWGAALFAGLIAYLIWSFRKPGVVDAPDSEVPGPSVWISVLWVAGGLAFLMLGARALVDGSVNIARTFGVSEAYIGLTIVAIGTSLPELATSVIAALRRHSEIAIGNIVGSNIFNVLGILGITAMITPIPVSPRFLQFDLPFMLTVSTALTAMLLLAAGVGRTWGAALLASYGVYLWWAV